MKHEFTVAETFGGLGVAITISMADKPDSFPINVTGEMAAYRASRIGRAAHTSASGNLAAVASSIKNALFNEAAAIRDEKREAIEAERRDAISAAVKTAEDAAADKFARDLAARQAQWQRDQAEVDADNKFLEGRVGVLSDQLAALKTAKRSAAARKGHRSAGRAGKGAK